MSPEQEMSAVRVEATLRAHPRRLKEERELQRFTERERERERERACSTLSREASSPVMTRTRDAQTSPTILCSSFDDLMWAISQSATTDACVAYQKQLLVKTQAPSPPYQQSSSVQPASSLQTGQHKSLDTELGAFSRERQTGQHKSLDTELGTFSRERQTGQHKSLDTELGAVSRERQTGQHKSLDTELGAFSRERQTGQHKSLDTELGAFSRERQTGQHKSLDTDLGAFSRERQTELTDLG
ncbi:hypothetical protein JZ751_020443 [Albula glossodonta]|uniref:Uncharacterized protein n=1 Tax=Albula glossodonta TaxID=121402 RepID=A0A8T2MZE1_9TELE|nr:hypothetical protein JZ751_020443 [Albula glossodonta]